MNPIATAEQHQAIVAAGVETATRLRALVEQAMAGRPQPLCERSVNIEVARIALVGLFAALDELPWINRTGLVIGTGVGLGEIIAQLPRSTRNAVIDALSQSIATGEERARVAFEPRGNA